MSAPYEKNLPFAAFTEAKPSSVCQMLKSSSP